MKTDSIKRYDAFTSYLHTLPLKPYQIARVLHLMQNVNFDLLPDGYATPPHTINISVNNICNFKWIYCDLHQGRKNRSLHNAKIDFGVTDNSAKRELSLETCKRLVDEVAWFKPTIRVPWMEPLLYKDLLPLIAYTKSKGLDFSMLTNGFLLKKYAEALCQSGVDALRVSLDDPERVHNKCCGVDGAYRLIIEGLQHIAMRNRQGVSDMALGCYFTLNGENYDQMLPMVEELERFGLLDAMSVSFFIPNYISSRQVAMHNEHHAKICGVNITEASIDLLNLKKIHIDTVLEQKEYIRKRFGGARIYFRPDFTKENLSRFLEDSDLSWAGSRCDVMNHTLYINPSGDVKIYPQCILPPVGNIFKNSLMDIWNGETLRGYRKLVKENPLFYGCRRCWCAYLSLEDGADTWK